MRNFINIEININEIENIDDRKVTSLLTEIDTMVG